MSESNTQEQKPKFSFVMPVYNDAKTVERAVESILDQDMKSFEVILVNDGSTDDSLLRCQVLSSMYPDKVRFINLEKNQGACVARNTGAKSAKGEYLAWLPADAKLYPGMLRIWMDALDENKDVDFVYGGYRVTDEEYNAIAGGDFMFEPFDPYLLEVTNYIDGSFPIRATTYWDLSKKLGLEGLWDPQVKSLQDWDFWLTVVKNGGKGLYLRDIFFETTMPHKGGLSDDSSNNWLERTTFIKKKHGIPDRKICVGSLGAGWHARNVAKMLGADFKEMPSFKANEYESLYIIGFYPEFATQQDQMFWNDMFDQSKGRSPAKKVVHFVGSDVWQLYHVNMMNLKFWREYFKQNVDVLLCESEFIKAELEDLGIKNVRVVPIPPAKIYDVMPLPEKFTVAVYQPQTNAEFYYPQEMERIAQMCPEIEFKFFGNPIMGGRKKDSEGKETNIEYMGYIEPSKMENFIRSCSAIIRFPQHDGLPLSVIEFLTAGRYSIQSVPMEHTNILPMQMFAAEKVAAGLKKLKETVVEPNIEGSKFWREKANQDKYRETMLEILKYNPKEYWEGRADSWVTQAASMEVEKDQVKEVFDEAKKLLGKDNPNVIDAGCGDGRWFPILKEWGIGSYIGYDISERLVEVAKSKFPEESFVCSKVEAFLSDPPQDILFSYTTLEHITEEEFPKAVEALKKTAKYLLLVEPTDFKSRNYCHSHDYSKHFEVVKEVKLADKKILLCCLQ